MKSITELSYEANELGSAFDLDTRSFVRLYVLLLACRANFSATRKFWRRKHFWKKNWAVAIVFLQTSWESELSSRFLSRLKFENLACHFLANSGDRPRICTNLIMIRQNPGTIGWIHQKVAMWIISVDGAFMPSHVTDKTNSNIGGDAGFDPSQLAGACQEPPTSHPSSVAVATSRCISPS